jgi:hypothetical protein
MNDSNKKIILITLIISAVLLYFYYTKKGGKGVFANSKILKKLTNQKFTESDAIPALKKAEKIYGTDAAALLERMYRRETAHFTSGQYKNTGSAGMEVGSSKKYPYGWSQPKKLWDDNPKYKPVGTYTTPENQTGIVKTFIKFPSVEAAVLTLAEVLKKRGWNAGSWYSRNKILQDGYNSKLNQIKNRIIV